MKHPFASSLAGVVLVCSAVGPIASAESNRTERIPLRFVTVAEAEGIFAPPKLQEGQGGLGPGAALGALPAGVVAIASDAAGKGLIVTGSRKGLEDLRQIVRLLDIPARPVRLTVKALTPDASLREELKSEVVPTTFRGGATGQVLIVEVGVKQLDGLVEKARKRNGVLLETVLDTANNRRAHLFVPRAGAEPRKFTLLPRVNGDSSITLYVQEDEGVFAIRRVASGSDLILVPDDGVALLVRAESSLPKK